MGKPLLAAAVLLAAAAAPAAASHGDERFTAEGTLQAGHPGAVLAGGVSENAWKQTGSENPAGAPFEGADSDVVPLPSWAPGHPIWANGSASGSPDLPGWDPYDLDVRFYDDARTEIDADCATTSNDETCEVPAGATHATVRAGSGVDVNYTLAVQSSDAGGSGGPSYSIPLWYTWNDTSLDVVIVPPATGPLYDRSLRLLPAGSGLATESPYVNATEDVIRAWDRGLAAYAANHSGASYLADFAFDVSVVGDDATPTDLREAEIRIFYTLTGGTFLGVSVGTRTDGERFQRCDIVNSQWLGFSFTVADAYNVYGHEFGHCLGLSHPDEPGDDLMHGVYGEPIGDPSTARACISTLDARGMAAAYDWLSTSGGWKPPPTEAELPESDYDTYPAVNASNACPN